MYQLTDGACLNKVGRDFISDVVYVEMLAHLLIIQQPKETVLHFNSF